MKKSILSLILLFVFSFLWSQKIFDYKLKTKTNAKDRTMILDIFRAKLYENYKEEFVFVVNSMNVYNDYVWLMVDTKRKDGKEFNIDKDGEYDCCHAEALFRKKSGKWYIIESGEFSTDVWYVGLWESYKLPQKMFFKLE
ncbi:hypothetical protein [Frigoriflavimonas asaccharolytica]|uniref:Uncharacterized protein n=1 Tax=Frigoriflavimonas asaccharolytica TaxID=2735899 RepID=A0A8J8G6J0_9FLAO|nr:hypothetical protein [Frigoriflavimonas asaccharolytica]NRS92184.1 hypothetical protein [Frigoriflavimonas asaccharolytica]